MHRSRLYGVFVDVPLGEADSAAEFWAQALGAAPVRGDEDDPYVAMYGANPMFAFEVQAVDDTQRYHLDIETDDVEAEVARLKDLGANEYNRHSSWVVLQAPGGHLVCVVPVQSQRDFFDAHAKSWGD